MIKQIIKLELIKKVNGTKLEKITILHRSFINQQFWHSVIVNCN